MKQPWEIVIREDGHTFLSQQELDEYRDGKMQAAWLEGEYASSVQVVQ